MKKNIILFFSIPVFCFYSNRCFAQGDSPCTAVTLTVGASCSLSNGTTVGNTYNNNAANGGTPTCATPGAPDVWYKFVAPASGNITIDTDVNSITDGGMALYSATNCSTAVTQITCDDDGSANGLMPMIAATGLTSGATYYVRFWQYSSGTGTFKICVYDNPPAANDSPCNAVTLTVGGSCSYTSGTTVGATYSSNAANGGTPSCATPGAPDVWYKFTAPAGGSVWIDTQTGTITDGGMTVYSASSCSTGITELECDDDDSNNGSMPFISRSGLTSGSTYYIRIWKYSSGTGTFGVCVQTPPPPVADFSGTPLTICTGATVAFTDLSTNSPTSWSWTFTGGTPATSTAQNPTITYSTAGNYNVTLTVTNSSGSDAESKNNYVTVNNCPPSPQDCINSIPICQSSYSEANAYSGTGNIAPEINSSTSCLSSGEKNDVWYIFTTLASGNLDFEITPNKLTDDYDWAVYNLTSANCSDIYGNSALEVSCNYSATDGLTGPNGGSGSNSQGAGGTPFNAVIPVVIGQTYAINVSQFSTSTNGYTIDFSSSTATIYDNVAPSFQSVITPIACGATQITFNFSENVLCSTVSNSDFTLTGPGGPYTLSGVTGAACSVGGQFENTFTATISPALTTSGSFSLNLVGSVTDNCGNTAALTNKPFTINNVDATTSQTNILCPCAATGAASASGTGGTPSYTYSWSTTSTISSISGLTAGNYTVTVTDANTCKVIKTINVTEPAQIVINLNSQTNISCFGQTNGAINVTATGGTAPYDYSKDGGSTWSFNNVASGTPVNFSALTAGTCA